VTISAFLVTIAEVYFEGTDRKDDGLMARECRDYATIALQLEEDARLARCDRDPSAGRERAVAKTA
jgi:hypothetical protein